MEISSLSSSKRVIGLSPKFENHQKLLASGIYESPTSKAFVELRQSWSLIFTRHSASKTLGVSDSVPQCAPTVDGGVHQECSSRKGRCYL